MSRHTFALSVLLGSIAFMMLLVPAQGQVTIGLSPAHAMNPMSHHGFYCVFDYDFYDYSDYDYNDYSYTTAPVHDASVFFGCDADFCESTPIPVHQAVQSATDETAATPVDDMINYGCAGYCYDDYDLYGYEYDEAYEGLYGSYSDCEYYDELYEHEEANETADNLQHDAEGLTSNHDALYDEVVYGVLPEIVCEDPQSMCATYAWGQTDEIDPEVACWIEETSYDVAEMVRDASGRVVQSGSRLPGYVGQALRLDAVFGRDVEPVASVMEWDLDDTITVSLGVLSDAIPQWEMQTKPTQQRVLVETAETLEGAAEALREAASQLRRMARGNRLTWKGIPYRR